MSVALVFFTCIVLASCSFSDSYLVGKTRDPFWAHRPYSRLNNRPSSSNSRSSSRYSNSRYKPYSNGNSQANIYHDSNSLNDRFSNFNEIDNPILSEIKLKKFFHNNGNRFQYFDNNRNRDSFGWDYPSMEFLKKVKMPKLPPLPAMPKVTREWPDYIPPIRMIKLPLDEPPAP